MTMEKFCCFVRLSKKKMHEGTCSTFHGRTNYAEQRPILPQPVCQHHSIIEGLSVEFPREPIFRNIKQQYHCVFSLTSLISHKRNDLTEQRNHSFKSMLYVIRLTYFSVSSRSRKSRNLVLVLSWVKTKPRREIGN